MAACALGLAASCVHKKYENPITKATQQPDKILFDQAVRDIEHGRYEVARISLQTLMNTYESSEYMAKAKLAVADSWYRQGGSGGMAQAEAEYKDFELFYPQMEEAAEAQNRICEIHYKEMDRSDRDDTQALRAQDECKQLLVQYPNSKFAPKAAQMLRNIQESLAEHEFVVGNFYWKREMHPAAANRLNGLVDQFPLYSKADEALYEAGDSYSKMGPRFRKTAGEEFARIVQEYPMGTRAEEAKQRLEDMEMPVPQVDPSALARMKFEEENYKGPSLMARSIGWVHSGPDVAHAAKEGSPTMTNMKKTIPASVPIVANAEATASAGGPGATGTTDVSATTVGANSALDQNADARTNANGAAASQTANNNSTAPLPSNRQKDIDRMQKERAKKQAALQKKAKKKHKDDSDQEATPAAASSTPAVSTASPTGNELSAPGAATSPAQAQPVPSATTPTAPAAPQQ